MAATVCILRTDGVNGKHGMGPIRRKVMTKNIFPMMETIVGYLILSQTYEDK